MDEKQINNQKNLKKIRTIKKIEKYSLNIGILCILIGMWFPVLNYISTVSFALTYITALIKQKLQNGKISFLSFVLCSASLSWVVLRQFYNSPYVTLFGQIILYSYLMQSQYTLLGKIEKSFACFAIIAVGLGVMRIFYPSTLTNTLNFIMQLWILFRFLDPVLENIGQAHRKKRLAEEARRAEEQKKNGNSVEQKEEKKESLLEFIEKSVSE